MATNSIGSFAFFSLNELFSAKIGSWWWEYGIGKERSSAVGLNVDGDQRFFSA